MFDWSRMVGGGETFIGLGAGGVGKSWIFCEFEAQGVLGFLSILITDISSSSDSDSTILSD
jgi:hypothetical protein